jgi:prephenate dehydrogenase
VSLDAGAAGRLGAVRVVGTGLLGASVALGLRASNVRVLLFDTSPTALALAHDVGAGEVDTGDCVPGLVVVATPPDVVAGVVAAELAAHPEATVTDVASVKSGVAARLADVGADLSRYVGGHPLAGRERSGAVAARADLFLGRPWVVCPTACSAAERTDAVRSLVHALGGTPVTMAADEHDAAVALVSHLPQVASSLVAARLREAPEPAVGLASQGLRDLTRIAGSDPTLWAQILTANAGPVLEVLRALREDLEAVISALAALASADGVPTPPTSPAAPLAPGARAVLAHLVADGNAGRERIPGKHGTAPTAYAVVTALLPDRPGQLGRLFHDIAEAGINVEEFSLEHSPGQPVGMAEVSVLPGARAALEAALVARGWHVVA